MRWQGVCANLSLRMFKGSCEKTVQGGFLTTRVDKRTICMPPISLEYTKSTASGKELKRVSQKCRPLFTDLNILAS